MSQSVISSLQKYFIRDNKTISCFGYASVERKRELRSYIEKYDNMYSNVIMGSIDNWQIICSDSTNKFVLIQRSICRVVSWLTINEYLDIDIIPTNLIINRFNKQLLHKQTGE
ncbi:MAG: hypothetical protein K1X91_16095 [Bacteriodetes bacterium]|nr:hypothetical protein [Bacteroidota bacterium]